MQDAAGRVAAIVRSLAEGEGGDERSSREAALLEWLITTYSAQRSFATPGPQGGEPSAEDFGALFRALLAARFASEAWWSGAAEASKLVVLQALRLLMRDGAMQAQWAAQAEAAAAFAARLRGYSDAHCGGRSEDEFRGEFTVEIVGELAAMAKRLPVELAEPDVLESLVLLLRSPDAGVLHSVVVSLTRLAIHEERHRHALCQLDPVDLLLAHLRDGEPNLRMAAAELLLLLARERRTRDDIRASNGAALFLSLVSSESTAAAVAALHLLCSLAREPEAGREVRLLGGLPLLVGQLQRCCADAAEQPQTEQPPEGQVPWAEGLQELAEGLCLLIGKLALEDESAYQLRQANAVHTLGRLVLRCVALCRAADPAALRLQGLGFRALRTLYACVRNRRAFDRLWPSELLVAFTDMPLENYLLAEFAGGSAGAGVTAAELEPFLAFAKRFNTAMASAAQRGAVEAALHDIDVKAAARRTLGDYDLLDLLGKGAFGTVYKVRHRRLGGMFALKQLAGLSGGEKWASTPRRPGTARVEESQVAAMAQEVSILSTLEHPHIVNYYEQVQCDDGTLAIVMEYVEGASLRERIAVALETRTPIAEEESWRITLQITLALRYLHMEMRIIHRDLTPGNVLLQHVPGGGGGPGGGGSVVKIADFGLATALAGPDRSGGKGEALGQVGTMLYAAPEIVQSQPYTHTADVWSLGCIMHEMVALRPPFAASSLLHVVKRIVECDHEPLLTHDDSGDDSGEIAASSGDPAAQAGFSVGSTSSAAGSEGGFSAVSGASGPPLVCRCSREMAQLVSNLLVVDPAERPSMVRVAEMLAPRMMGELERISATQRDLLAEVRSAEEERQRAILEGALGREARAALRTRARTAAAGDQTEDRAARGRAARADRLQASGEAAPARGAGDVISIPATALRQISDPATELLATMQQVLRVAELPPTTGGGRGDRQVRRLLTQYKTYLRETRVSVLKAELSKLATRSTETIPQAAELAETRTYVEMAAMLEEAVQAL